MKTAKKIGTVVLCLPVITIRTVCRFVGSLIFNIVNIFVGIKNLFVLIMKERQRWRWPFLIVKLPLVLTIQAIKLVLTATLGTLFNFFESIFMTSELVSSMFKGEIVETRALYNWHIPGYRYESKNKKEYFEVLLTFMCGAINIVFDKNNPSGKNYPNASMLFLYAIGKFLGLGHSDNGIDSFNAEMVTSEIYANASGESNSNGSCYLDYIKYKHDNKPAITAAAIIAPYEVL